MHTFNTLGAAIKNIDLRLIIGGFNNNINNEVNIGALDRLDAAIKNADVEPIVSWSNNNMGTKVNVGMFMGKVIYPQNGCWVYSR